MKKDVISTISHSGNDKVTDTVKRSVAAKDWGESKQVEQRRI